MLHRSTRPAMLARRFWRPSNHIAAAAVPGTAATNDSLPPPGNDGWVWALSLDASGGGRMLQEWDPLVLQLLSESPLGGVTADLVPDLEPVPDPAKGGCWVHLDFSQERPREWLKSTESWSSSRSDRGSHRSYGSCMVYKLQTSSHITYRQTFQRIDARGDDTCSC